jgi:acetyltransferase-like isoleucine patch superfamily enzyme
MTHFELHISGHEEKTMSREHGYEEVEARWAEIDSSATVSSAAVVGSPGEWIGKPTKFPAVVGANVVIREFARVHAGCIRETVIGNDTLMMAGSHVGHDAILGAGVHLAPNVVVGGVVEIGDHSHIGLGAVILPHKKIGRNCIIGAGSVVTRDIPDGQVWAGNPAVFRKDTEREMPA